MNRWKNQFKCKNNKFFHKSTCISQKSSNFVLAKQKRGAARRPKKSKPRWRNGRRARFRCECCEACRFESCSGHLNPLIIDRFSRGFLFPKCTKSVLNAKVYCKNRSRKERIDEKFSQYILSTGIAFRIEIWQHS